MLFNEVIGAALLLVYNVFIILYVSRKMHERFGKYIARKTIHLLSAGVSVLLMPFLFHDLLFPLLLAEFAVALTLIGHIWKTFPWFQESQNYADVYFTFACAALLAVFWNNNVWIGVLSVLFMAWGDGLTGIVRNFVYKKRTKGLWGNVAMFIVCACLGYVTLGYVGLIGGAFSAIVEKFEWVDDNISVPFGSATVMSLLRFL